ncbi:acyltransferase [Cryobacterium sp. TMT1-21]|uniref:acyltransferase family protein n=1 Tax=Cryobacterium sp. TMT1-21 TaxID=1259234 RepID=UPI00106A0997|nr:acyltransferase [Cryobacterium sp. TMT1-21]TFD10165.1 acyltransferase [Cryobacterium sp. TMT1-21]
MTSGSERSVRPLLEGLTGVRAIAAAWVVIEHFRHPLFALIPRTNGIEPYVMAGFLGVEVFFVLSGFIIAYNYAERFQAFNVTSYRDFLILRVARIYPVHLLTLLIVTALFTGAAVMGIKLSAEAIFGPANVFGNLLMLQALPPFDALNGPAWSIGAEFAAYIAFPVVALWLARLKTPRSAFFSAAAVCAAGLTVMMWVTTTIGSSPTGYEMIWIRISTEFTLGTLLYAGWRHLGARKTGNLWDWLAIVSLVCVLATVAVSGGDSTRGLLALPFIALLVLSCAGATGWVGGLLRSRLMQWGGRISYSVYMTHFLLLMIFGKLLPWDRFENDWIIIRVLLMLAYYAAVVGAGAACYHWVEEPSRKRIRKVMASRQNKRTVRPVESFV